MYAEGQTLKIKATSTNPYHKIFGDKQLTVIVTMVNGNSVRIESDEFLPIRGRNSVSFIVEEPGTLGYYPDWDIEIVDAPIVKSEAPAPSQSAEPLSRESWDAMQRAYGPMMPENTYEEYLASHNASASKIAPADVSAIMDGLTVRQCRAIVNHQGFAPDASLVWAIRLGLILPGGAFTDKGRAFLASIYATA